MTAHDAGASRQFSTFFVADLFFGVEVLRVQEVLRFQQMTHVPKAPDVIEGLINLRGQIVIAIDMRRRLGLPPRAGDQTPMNIVVRTEDGAVSLLVDEIGDVLDVDAATYERPPDNLDPAAREFIHGVYKLKDRLLLVLDAERTVDLTAARARVTGKSRKNTRSRSKHGETCKRRKARTFETPGWRRCPGRQAGTRRCPHLVTGPLH